MFTPVSLLAARTELADDKGDWSEFPVRIDFTGYDYRITAQSDVGVKCTENEIPRKDITSAHYTLNEGYLNATAWLEDSFQETPPSTVKGIIYTMSLVDLSGAPNPIYSVANSWDPDNSWRRTVYEHSLSNATRVSESSIRYNGFGNSTVIPGNSPKSYVDFYLDVRKLALPENFLILFTIVEFSDQCFLIDTLGESLTSAPLLDILTTPTIEVRQGESKNVSLTLESSTLELENVTIGSENIPEISVTFLNSTIGFDTSGKAFPVSKVTVATNSSPREYAVPFFVNVSIPQTIIYPVLFTNIEAERKLEMSKVFVDHIPIKVLPAYTGSEIVNNFLQANAGILSLIALVLSSLGGIGTFYSISKTRKREN